MKNDMPHRVDIFGNVKYKNELGETAYKFMKVMDLWASVVPQTGSLQNQQAETILTNVTHKVIVRYSSGMTITKDMQVHFRGHRFEIKYILNPYFANESLEIFCQELIE
ncbi:phage head closure protein [Sporosarcina sp. FSL K6-1522]|uniref:phage head closure protein n=1 Tax=Sporosarcina sp. FSL K6-1522 TaxID=2921554 RepID=UPI00315B0467